MKRRGGRKLDGEFSVLNKQRVINILVKKGEFEVISLLFDDVFEAKQNVFVNFWIEQSGLFGLF